MYIKVFLGQLDKKKKNIVYVSKEENLNEMIEHVWVDLPDTFYVEELVDDTHFCGERELENWKNIENTIIIDLDKRKVFGIDIEIDFKIICPKCGSKNVEEYGINVNGNVTVVKKCVCGFKKEVKY